MSDRDLHSTSTQGLWWLHDGRWYQEVARRFGHAAANEINADAVRFVAYRVGRSVARNLRKSGDEFEPTELVAALHRCVRKMWPEHYLRIDYEHGGDLGEITMVIKRNYALHMVRLAGSMEQYRCPCHAVRSGWLEGLGFEVKENRAEACMRTGDAACVQVSRYRADPDARRAGRAR
ncbi:hypothetical protein ACFWQL_22060 [Amycolatopsis thermoflava]|uniref:hypothetical protein n=1 Tax=Amycolatopsis thermoflava TaxID=84480 RepID=UPI003660C2ED